MKKNPAAIILLVIGVLGTVASVYNMIVTKEITEYSMFFISSVSLLYGWWELRYSLNT